MLLKFLLPLPVHYNNGSKALRMKGLEVSP